MVEQLVLTEAQKGNGDMDHEMADADSFNGGSKMPSEYMASLVRQISEMNRNIGELKTRADAHSTNFAEIRSELSKRVAAEVQTVQMEAVKEKQKDLEIRLEREVTRREGLEREGRSRQWQLWVLFGGAVISWVGVAVSMLLHFKLPQ